MENKEGERQGGVEAGCMGLWLYNMGLEEKVPHDAMLLFGIPDNACGALPWPSASIMWGNVSASETQGGQATLKSEHARRPLGVSACWNGLQGRLLCMDVPCTRRCWCLHACHVVSNATTHPSALD